LPRERRQQRDQTKPRSRSMRFAFRSHRSNYRSAQQQDSKRKTQRRRSAPHRVVIIDSLNVPVRHSRLESSNKPSDRLVPRVRKIVALSVQHRPAPEGLKRGRSALAKESKAQRNKYDKQHDANPG